MYVYFSTQPCVIYSVKWLIMEVIPQKMLLFHHFTLGILQKLSKWILICISFTSISRVLPPVHDLMSLTSLLQISFRFRILLHCFFSKENKKPFSGSLFYHSCLSIPLCDHSGTTDSPAHFLLLISSKTF